MSKAENAHLRKWAADCQSAAAMHAESLDLTHELIIDTIITLNTGEPNREQLIDRLVRLDSMTKNVVEQAIEMIKGVGQLYLNEAAEKERQR
jgi:hypothetical protein